MSLLFGGSDFEYPEDIITGNAEPPQVSGIYIVADSAITSVDGSKTILGEFKKLVTMDACLWMPDFWPGGKFKGYGRIY